MIRNVGKGRGGRKGEREERNSTGDSGTGVKQLGAEVIRIWDITSGWQRSMKIEEMRS